MPTVTRFRKVLARWWFPALLILGPFSLGVVLYGSYVCDDDLVHLRYAERLIEGKGLTWNDGERVHGISAMFLIIVTAALRLLGVPLEVGMRAFSVVGTFASVLCVVYVSRRVGLSRAVAASLGGLLALFAPFSVWAMAGIGGAMFAACVGWSVVLVSEVRAGSPSWFEDRARRLVVTALLCVVQFVRPDALLMVGAVLMLMLADPTTRRRWRRFLLVPVLPVFSTAVLFAGLQLWYFATPVPHMTGVKFGFDTDLVGIGSRYVAEFLRSFFPLVALVPLLIFSPARRSFTVLAPLMPALVWVMYVVWIGGDWMPGNRHFAVVLLLLMVASVRALAASPKWSRLHAALLLIAAVFAAGVSVSAPAARRALDAAQWLEVVCDGSKDMGRLVGHLDPLLGVEPAGCPPYVTGMRGLDLLGLVDLHVSQASPIGRPIAWVEWVRMQAESPEDLQYSFIPGHGNGDGTYIWNREPDLLIGCNPLRSAASGCFRSFFEMQERFDFASRYRPLVLVLDSGKLWHAWVRFDAGVLGVQTTSRENHPVAIEVPVWLLTASPHAPLRVNSPDASRSTDPWGARIELNVGARLEVPALGLPEGEWSLRGVSEHLVLSTTSTCAQVDGYNLRVSSPDCSVALVLAAASATSVGNLSLQKVS